MAAATARCQSIVECRARAMRVLGDDAHEAEVREARGQGKVGNAAHVAGMLWVVGVGVVTQTVRVQKWAVVLRGWLFERLWWCGRGVLHSGVCSVVWFVCRWGGAGYWRIGAPLGQGAQSTCAAVAVGCGSVECGAAGGDRMVAACLEDSIIIIVIIIIISSNLRSDALGARWRGRDGEPAWE